MKTIVYFIFIALILAGCKKSSPTTVIPVATLTGKYVSFKIIDTSYNNSLIADGIYQIRHETATGDTDFYNPGAANYTVNPNDIQNYQPSWATSDTLNFTSSTAGAESDPTGTYPFTYSLQTGAFDDGANDPNLHIKLIKLNTSTIEIVAFEQQGIYVADGQATYYKKE